jgi:hypothetical protein
VKIAIATLRERTALWEFIDGKERCGKALREAGHDVVGYNIRATYLARGRNVAVKEFLADEFQPDYLWFLDSDVVAPVQAGPRLLSAQKDIVSGLYVQKHFPHVPEAYRWEDQAYLPVAPEIASALRSAEVGMQPGMVGHNPLLMRVDGVGAGCLLIHRRVLERLGKGCFGPTESGMGEDLWFCKQAQEAGFDIWLDFGVICGHLALRPVTAGHFMLAHKRLSPVLQP